MTQMEMLAEEGFKVDEKGEIHHQGPLSIHQDYEKYTEEDHDVWKTLFTSQWENLQGIAYQPWLDAIEAIGLVPDYIPKLSEVGEIISSKTGWQPVPISGFLTAKEYFSYLAQRKFPTVVSMRPRESLEFIVEPDLFHDGFGHLPMHTHPVFADFLQLFGESALAAETDQQMLELQRLYWFTVEYGLIRVKGQVQVAGSGHMSGIKESRFSLTDDCEKLPFELEAVCQQDFNPHILQARLFVMDCYDQLYDAMSAKAKEIGVA